ncbi:MAG TPA: glycosyl hydrolase family 28-related protein, partial [Edaphobacter sp.]|nr:glycosyl hydrolase family 28-related protein [Edaphobacter sp.]
MKKLLTLLALCCAPMSCVRALAQSTPWSSILSAPTGSGANTGLAIDWSQTGLNSQGGIPTNRTQCGSTIAATGSDQSSAINSALSGCGSGHFVQLAAGTYTINSSISIPSNVTLRGTGADQTKLSVHGSSAGAINLGSGGVSYTGVLNITSGGGAGSTSLTLSGTSGVSVGSYMVVSETNDSAYVTNLGGEGTASWVDGWSTNGTRARGQIVEVRGVSGNTVTIFPALYSSYTHSPTVVPFSATKFAGVEDLQIVDNNTGYT